MAGKRKETASPPPPGEYIKPNLMNKIFLIKCSSSVVFIEN